MSRLTNSDLMSASYSPWELCGLDKDCLRSCEECNIVEMYKKLAAYEDIGLKPEELQEMVNRQKWHLLSDEDYPPNEKQYIITASVNGEKIVFTGYWDEKRKDFLYGEYIYFGDVLLIPIAWKELPQPWEGETK